MMNHRTAPHRRLAAVLAGACVALAACGSGEGTASNDGVASLDTGTDDTGTDDTDTSDEGDVELDAPADPEEAMALFQSCMTDHGVEGGGFAIATRSGSDGEMIEVGSDPLDSEELPAMPMEEIDPEVFEAANEACNGHLANAMPEFDLTPEQEAAMEDARLEFEQCMEEQGVEMPEMVTRGDGGSLSISVGGETGEPVPALSLDDIDMDAFNAAAEECQKVYDEYPELDDVMQGGGAMVVGRVDAP